MRYTDDTDASHTDFFNCLTQYRTLALAGSAREIYLVSADNRMLQYK